MGVFMKFKNIFRSKRTFLPLTDLVSVFLSAFLAILVVNEELLLMSTAELLWAAFNFVAVFAVFAALKLYSISFSSVGIYEFVRLTLAIFSIGIANLIFYIAAGKKYGITLGVIFVYIFLLAFLTGSARISKRLLRSFRAFLHRADADKKRVMIVGGGETGALIIREMLYTENTAYNPVCIADDNPSLFGKRIFGVKVVSDTFHIKENARKYGADEIFITMPSADNRTRKEIIERCNETGLPVKALPSLYQLADGQVSVSKLRNVDIQDLLGREPVRVNLDEIMGYIEGKTVLVTGGGGSIGSELCRQLAAHSPRQLIILDIYENTAYDIEQEIKRKYPKLNLITLIASIRDKNKIRSVFELFRPEIVFNAAAHKHVPLMETSPCEAVKNNVFGTLNVARAADEFGAETFVQISTDKAVNPTNIMGATKRICEMIVQTIGRHSKNTNFVAVRFGNVLGSNGSVIPLFKKQIAEGGPVTVTDKRIIRYFMTIPEAVSLVLQAGAYAKGGQIFVLDMGEPVKIDTLARNLIRLSGLKPDIDIEIKYTGLRPGEKLYEERLMEEEGLQKTDNGLISIARPIPIDEDMLWERLEVLYSSAYSETDGMKELVRELVPTYEIDKSSNPEKDIKETVTV